MKLTKILGIVLGVGFFLLLNKYDVQFFEGGDNVSYSKFIQKVFGQDTETLVSSAGVKFITVNNHGDIKSFITRASTPVDALVSNGYAISNLNKLITTSPIDVLSDYAYITIQTYRTVYEDVTLSIPYSEVVKGETLCQNLTQEVVEKEGVLGVKTQTLKKVYEGGTLVATEIVKENVVKNPINKIIILVGPDDTPDSVPQVGYSCDYWFKYVDENVSASAEEKQWLKFTMKWESGCNAESDSSYYKGLFQWDPCLWYEQYPNDNIYDGRKQIKRTLQKLRAGANPARMWPAVYKLYVAKYGELSWLSDN